MPGFFAKLFGRNEKKEADFALPREVYNPTNEADRVAVALLAILGKQLDLLGFSMGSVPIDQTFGSDQCRGALLGTAIGIVQSEVESPSNKAILDATTTAFALVYGDEIGPRYALETIRDSSAGNDVINASSEWAIGDTKGVYSSGGVTSAVGFYVAAKQMIE